MKNPNRPKNANNDLARVRDFMLKQKDFVSAEVVCLALGYDLVKKLGSIKSRLRDLKLEMFGGFRKKTRWVSGVMEYKIELMTPTQMEMFESYKQHTDDYTHPDNGGR